MYKEFGKEYLMAQMMKNGVMGMVMETEKIIGLKWKLIQMVLIQTHI